MLRLRDIMTRDVHTMTPDFTVRDAMEFLAKHRVSGAPVVNDGKLLGVVSANDLIAFTALLPGAAREQREAERDWEDENDEAEWEEDADPSGEYFTDLWFDTDSDVDVRFRESGGPEWSTLENHAVSEAMTEKVHALPPNTEVSFAADYMRRARIHRVLVVDDGELRGIVSVMDIATAVADHRLMSRTFVFGKPTALGRRR